MSRDDIQPSHLQALQAHADPRLRLARAWKLALAYGAGLLLLTQAPLWALASAERRQVEEGLRDDLAHTVSREADSFAESLSQACSELRFLADDARVQRSFNEPEALREAEASLLSLARISKRYAQIRILDGSGKERVRVERRGDALRAVGGDELQDKGRRYYLRRSLALKEGEVYVSPFDLNVEGGRVEEPPNPMIRLASPVYGPAGERRGVVIMNFAGGPVLRSLREAAAARLGELWLVNSKGNWLLGPRPEVEWTFMRPKVPQQGMFSAHPETWRAIESWARDLDLQTSEGSFAISAIGPSRLAMCVSSAVGSPELSRAELAAGAWPRS